MSKPLRVLIIEDSENDTKLIAQELRRGGYDVTHERVDTQEGMNQALDKHQWDIIISDHRMPHFSSVAALKLYKERKCDVPFIVVSGSIGEELAVTAMKSGAHDYIMKDNLLRLVPAVERELREAEGRRERKKTETALDESNRKLHEAQQRIIQQERLRALGGMAAGVAHDFNRLLAKVLGFSELLLTSPDKLSDEKTAR